MKTVWITIDKLGKMTQKQRSSLAVNFGKRIVPLSDIDLDIFSKSFSLPIVRVSIFDEVEKNYLKKLLDVINVTRDQGTTVYIIKNIRFNRKKRKDNFEIMISYKYNREWYDITLPQFSTDKNYYRGMVVDNSYDLEEQLELPAKNICD